MNIFQILLWQKYRKECITSAILINLLILYWNQSFCTDMEIRNDAIKHTYFNAGKIIYSHGRTDT